MYFQHGQPVIEIAPKIFCIHGFIQVTIRGGDNAHVDRIKFCPSYRPDFMFLQNLKKRDLKLRRHFSDFIQKYCSSIRAPQQTPGIGHGSAECSPDMAKEFAFKKVCGQRAAIYLQERPSTAFSGVVHHAGQKAFSRPGFSCNEQRRV